jgi:hypothetical protein
MDFQAISATILVTYHGMDFWGNKRFLVHRVLDLSRCPQIPEPAAAEMTRRK